MHATIAAPERLEESPALAGLFHLAAQWAGAGRMDDALPVFRTLALAAPDHYESWEALASCHDQLGQCAVARSLRAIGKLLEAPAPKDGSP